MCRIWGGFAQRSTKERPDPEPGTLRSGAPPTADGGLCSRDASGRRPRKGQALDPLERGCLQPGHHLIGSPASYSNGGRPVYGAASFITRPPTDLHEVRFCYRYRKSPPVQACRHTARVMARTRQPIGAPKADQTEAHLPFRRNETYWAFSCGDIPRILAGPRWRSALLSAPCSLSVR